MELVEKSEQFVSALLLEKLPPAYVYHSLNHTAGVVGAATTIAKFEQIPHEDTIKLIIAAWFHDVGYIQGAQNHEEVSVQIAADFLRTSGCDEAYIGEVSDLILATVFSHEPQNTLEKILRDADYFHFSYDDYQTFCGLLRREWELTQARTFTDAEWAQENLLMLKHKHQFYTSYAKMFWQPVKDRNIERVEKKLKKVAKSTEERPERGIDTLFRVTLNNHTRLSEIADSKANILLSVNAIIISIVLSTLIPKLDSPSNAHLITPTFVLVIFSVVSIIFAILSTRPKVTSGTFSAADVQERKVNLLFFGNFYKMPYQEYEQAVNEMMKDREYLYNSLIKDLYYLGLVLERKYRLLRITYNIFMTGIIVSVMSFIVAFKTSLG